MFLAEEVSAVEWQLNPSGLLLLAAAGVSVTLAFSAWRRRSSPGGMPLALLALAAAVWQAGYALELMSIEQATKVLWAKAQYLGIVSLSTTWLAVALQYTGRGEWLTRSNLALICAIPVATLVLVWTNESHGLIWSGSSFEVNGIGSPQIAFEHGAAFWLFGGYSYVLLLAGMILSADHLLRSSPLYRKQSAALLVSALAPWIANWMFMAGVDPIDGLDLTPFAFLISGFVLFWALAKAQLQSFKRF